MEKIKNKNTKFIIVIILIVLFMAVTAFIIALSSNMFAFPQTFECSVSKFIYEPLTNNTYESCQLMSIDMRMNGKCAMPKDLKCSAKVHIPLLGWIQ